MRVVRFASMPPYDYAAAVDAAALDAAASLQCTPPRVIASAVSTAETPPPLKQASASASHEVGGRRDGILEIPARRPLWAALQREQLRQLVLEQVIKPTFAICATPCHPVFSYMSAAPFFFTPPTSLIKLPYSSRSRASAAGRTSPTTCSSRSC